MKIDKRLLHLIARYPHILGQLVGYENLNELHSKWIQYIWTPNTHRSLQAHRYSYKTSSITEIGALWYLLFNPNTTIGIFRKTFNQASQSIRNIGNMIRMDNIAALFYIAHDKCIPKTTMDRDDIKTWNFKKTMTREGNLNAYGMKSSVVGAHLNVGIFDDFVTIEDKISKAERKRTKILLEENVNNVLDPNAIAGFVGTPWHKQDAWEQCPEPLKFDVYSTGILSEEDIMKKRKSTTNVTYAANYELRHVASDSAMFTSPSFDRWQYSTRSGIGHIDKAYSGSDTNALTFCEKKKDGRFQVLGKIFEGHIKDHKQSIKQLHSKYYIGTVHSERNDDKGFMSEQLSDLGIPTNTYHENMNKHIKIKNYLLENGFWELIDFDPDTDPEYINQIVDYVEGSEPDDAPDSLASLGRILLGGNDAYVNRWNNA